jgi:FAD/FMN-containing dehydrogenase
MIITSVEQNNEELELIRCSVDASIFRVTPSLVVYPEDAGQVRQVVRQIVRAAERGEECAYLAARSAGTCMSGGSLTSGVVVDMQRYMNRVGVVEYRDSEPYITVQPGAFYRDMEAVTHASNLEMPVYTASKALCGVGGMFGNNCGGEQSLLHGKAANWVMRTRHVFADGNEYAVAPLSASALGHKCAHDTYESRIYRGVYNLIRDNWSVIERNRPLVSKNSAGYYLWNVLNPNTGDFDLNQLLVGSQGTLGITTEISWKLRPVESAAKMIVVMLPDISRLGDIVNMLLEYGPSSIESYDDASMKLAVRFFPDFIKSLGVRKAFSLGVQFLPELGMMMRGGVPKLILVVEFKGSSDEEIDILLQPAFEAVQKFGYPARIPGTDAGEEKYWTIRRESFNLLRKHLSGKRTAPFIDDVCVAPEFLPEFLPKLEVLLREYKLTYTIAGHAGDGNFHIIPLMDFRLEQTVDTIMELSDRVYALVAEYHGSITAEHNDGIIRTPYLHHMFDDEMLALFRQVKDIFDPLNIFNPGKKVSGSIEYIRDHIKRE